MLEYPDLNANLLQLAIATLLTGAGVAAVWLCVRREAGPWILAAVLALPILSVYMNQGYREVGRHGFMHASYVYGIALHGLPPEDPLMAGETLRYPYLHQWLLVLAMKVVPFSTGLGFALTNLATLLLTTLLLWAIMRQLTDRTDVRILGVVLALFGGPLLGGPLLGVIQGFGLPREIRHLPFSKFYLFGSNQLGFVFYLLSFLGALRMLAGRFRWGLIAVTVGACGAGLFYAFSWLILVASAGLFCGWLLLTGDAGRRRVAIGLGLAVGLGSLLALPYIMMIALSREGDAGLSLALDPAELLRNLFIALLAFVPPLVLIAFRRGSVAAWAVSRRPESMMVMIWFAVPALLGVVLVAPVGDQYKFLSHALLPLGVLSAVAFAELLRTRPLVSLGLLFLAMLPGVWEITTILRSGWPPSVPVRVERGILHHTDPAQDELYAWIAETTPENAVFVDTHLTVPPLGRRALYIALDTARTEFVATHPEAMTVLDGWVLEPRTFLVGVAGHAPEPIARRTEVALALLSADGPPVAGLLETIREDVNGRALFVIARSPELQARLHAEPALTEAYSRRGVSVFMKTP